MGWFRPAGDWWRVGRVAKLLIATQLAFNVGFYAVLPFLADHLRDDVALSGGVVGFVLGVRTLSQQGLFAVGGALADRFGARPMIVAGCALRSIGFAVLGLSGGLAGILAGAVLTGMAGALFSPAVESALAREASDPRLVGGLLRQQVFALFAVSGNVGSVIGPVVGTALVAVGFRTSCAAASALFACIGVAHRLLLPRRRGEHAQDRLSAGWTTVLGNRRFVRFAIGYSAYLVAYNQLYLALPHELERSRGSDTLLGPLFVLASLLVVTAQLRVTGRARRMGPAVALATGFGAMAAGFALVLLSVAALDSRTGALAAAVGCVALLTLGQMLVVPVAQDLVPTFAGDRHLGAHFGALASCGGVAVFVLNPVIGRLLDFGARPVGAWLLLVLIPVGAAVVITRALPVSTPARVGP